MQSKLSAGVKNVLEPAEWVDDELGGEEIEKLQHKVQKQSPTLWAL